MPKSKIESNPISLAYVVLTFLVFVAIVAFVLYVQVIIIEYINTTQKECNKIQPVKADMIKTFTFIVMASILLLLLLQLGQVLQIFQVKQRPQTCSKRIKS